MAGVVGAIGNNSIGVAGVAWGSKLMPVRVRHLGDWNVKRFRQWPQLRGRPGNGTVTIGASAADNVGVASLSVYLDGAMVSTGNSASASYNWNTRKGTRGTHTISATARDAAGNQSTATIQVKN